MAKQENKKTDLLKDNELIDTTIKTLETVKELKKDSHSIIKLFRENANTILRKYGRK